MENSRKQKNQQVPKTTRFSNSSMVIMGYIVGAYGVHGWIKLHVYTETVGSLLRYSTWWLKKENEHWKAVSLTEGRIKGNNLIVKIDQCPNRDKAQEYKGMQVAVSRQQLPNLPENGEQGYYWSDLIGATVTNLQGNVLGEVTGILETGANNVLKVQKYLEKERLIPFIVTTVTKVDIKQRLITVDWEINFLI